jgi:hypothetical protein
MFGLLTISGSLKAVSPLFHGGNEKTGSVVLLNRQKFITDNGAEDIPVISGNAIRGVLRRLIMSDMLQQIEYELNVSKPAGQKLYHALFTGGVLETVDEKSSGTIDIEMKKKIIENLPPARLFGFSIGNQIIESKLKVGQGLPICTELKEYLPDNINPKFSVYEMLTQHYQTRKDDLKAGREEGEQAVQMLIEHEVFSPGTVFYHEFKLEDPDDIDKSCMARVIKLWREKPFIGGKSAIGLGELKINYDYNESSEKYLKFLKDNKETITQVLDSLGGA